MERTASAHARGDTRAAAAAQKSSPPPNSEGEGRGVRRSFVAGWPCVTPVRGLLMLLLVACASALPVLSLGATTTMQTQPVFLPPAGGNRYIYSSRAEASEACTHAGKVPSITVCLPACLPACLPVCLSVRLSVCLSVRLSVRLSVWPSVRLSVCPSGCLAGCLAAWLPVSPSLYAPPPPCPLFLPGAVQQGAVAQPLHVRGRLVRRLGRLLDGIALSGWLRQRGVIACLSVSVAVLLSLSLCLSMAR